MGPLLSLSSSTLCCLLLDFPSPVRGYLNPSLSIGKEQMKGFFASGRSRDTPNAALASHPPFSLRACSVQTAGIPTPIPGPPSPIS